MESNDNSSQPVIHKFGDEELSDVTFVVGGEEFKCHKMGLAMRSSYFKAMFFSFDFKEKNPEKIPIEADPVTFKRLMDVIYTGQCNDWKKTQLFYFCNCYCFDRVSLTDVIVSLWKQVTSLLELADRFDMKEYVVTIVENCFIRCGECGENRGECEMSGIKLFIAAMYGMDEYLQKFTVTKEAVLNAVTRIKKERQTPLSLDMSTLEWILKLH